MQLAAALARIQQSQQPNHQPAPSNVPLSDSAVNAWTAMQCSGEWLYFDLYDFFPEAVIDDKAKFSAIELHGVRPVVASNGQETVTIDNENPAYYSVFVRKVQGGTECIGEFGQEEDAVYCAHTVAKTYDWKVFNFLKAQLM